MSEYGGVYVAAHRWDEVSVSSSWFARNVGAFRSVCIASVKISQTMPLSF